MPAPKFVDVTFAPMGTSKTHYALYPKPIKTLCGKLLRRRDGLEYPIVGWPSRMNYDDVIGADRNRPRGKVQEEHDGFIVITNYDHECQTCLRTMAAILRP